MTTLGPPTTDVLARIEQLRQESTAAILEAEEAESEARRKRRRAKNLLHKYDKLVQEHMGQLAFLPEESVGQPTGT